MSIGYRNNHFCYCMENSFWLHEVFLCIVSRLFRWFLYRQNNSILYWPGFCQSTFEWQQSAVLVCIIIVITHFPLNYKMSWQIYTSVVCGISFLSFTNRNLFNFFVVSIVVANFVTILESLDLWNDTGMFIEILASIFRKQSVLRELFASYTSAILEEQWIYLFKT